MKVAEGINEEENIHIVLKEAFGEGAKIETGTLEVTLFFSMVSVLNFQVYFVRVR